MGEILLVFFCAGDKLRCQLRACTRSWHFGDRSSSKPLLFSPDEKAFGRKVRKYNSALAGEASAAFSLQLGRTAVFDCRMIPIPNVDRLQDYFRWRQEDAHRNSLNSHCYWMLRKEGESKWAATSQLPGKGVGYKNELLFSRGINYNELPAWQKRGMGLVKECYEKQGRNPITGETVTYREVGSGMSDKVVYFCDICGEFLFTATKKGTSDLSPTMEQDDYRNKPCVMVGHKYRCYNCFDKQDDYNYLNLL